MLEFDQPLLELVELALQTYDRIGGRIRHIDLRPVGDDANRLAVLSDDARRDADDRSVRGHVLDDDRAAADLRVIAEHDRPEHARSSRRPMTLRPSVG